MRAAGNEIRVTRGDTLSLHIELRDPSGATFEPAEGDELTLTVKRSAGSAEALITKHGQDVTIEPGDTSWLDFGAYRYDVQLTLADGRVCTVVPPSAFVVTEEVTW